MKFLKSLLPYLIIILIVILVRTYIVTPVRVNGTSMVPTLKGGEVMLLNKLGRVDRFDIVVVKLPQEDETIIKRVIALPGESIEISNHKIYVNDAELEDKYGYGVTYNIDKIALKDDEYFVLGDNRAISLDSRAFGPVKKTAIKGTTNFIMYPFKSFGKVKYSNTTDSN